MICKKYVILAALLSLMSCEILYAQCENSHGKEEKFKKRAVTISPVIVYVGKKTYRGALIWDAPIMAVAASFVFYNTVFLGMKGLGITKKVSKYHKITFGFSSFNDNRPGDFVLKLRDSKEDFKNLRRSTFGSYLVYGFRYRRYVGINIKYDKDLNSHDGNYYKIKLSTFVIPFVTLGVSSGLGDKKNNRYVYGPEAVGGIGHFDYLVSARLPFLPWNGSLIVNGMISRIVKDENVNADYVRGNKQNQVLSMLGIWKL